MRATLYLPTQEYLTDRTQPALQDPEWIATAIAGDLAEFYGRITDIRSADLGDLWALARDLVVALDRWGEAWAMPGEAKMEAAEAVAWMFLESRGGFVGLRERVVEAAPFRFVTGRVIRWLFNEERARALIRFVLELAVREVRRFGD